MPKSSPAGKMWSRRVLAMLQDRAPIHRVLDVGAGMGTYESFRTPGQTWIGLEVWAPYVEAYDLGRKYDELLTCDVRAVDWSALAPLDLVICGDVLEHMTKDEALAVIEKALD